MYVEKTANKVLLYFVLLVAILLIYFLSAGIAFITVYIWPENKCQRVYSYIYYPLDKLSEKNKLFSKIYNQYNNWCYKTFVT